MKLLAGSVSPRCRRSKIYSKIRVRLNQLTADVAVTSRNLPVRLRMVKSCGTAMVEGR